MNFLALYAIFAIATSLTALYELVTPVINKRKVERGDTMPIPLLYIIFFCINMLIAPIVFLSCIIPEWGIRFREALYDGLYKE
jgi:hypothetical protein